MVQPPARVSFAWLSWPTKQLPTLFKMWQSFAPKTDARFTSELYMSADGKSQSSTQHELAHMCRKLQYGCMAALHGMQGCGVPLPDPSGNEVSRHVMASQQAVPCLAEIWC